MEANVSGSTNSPVPKLTTTPMSSAPLFIIMAARILRPSSDGWKLLVRALKHLWLSIAIWSWKVLPVRGSCGDRSSVGTTEPCLHPHPTVAYQTCTLLRPRLKPRDNYVKVKSKQNPIMPKKRAPKADVLTVFGCASGDLERRSILLLRLAPVTGVTSAKPNCSAFSLSPIKTRRAASAASCLPCFLLCAHTAGNQRPPTFAW